MSDRQPLRERDYRKWFRATAHSTETRRVLDGGEWHLGNAPRMIDPATDPGDDEPAGVGSDHPYTVAGWQHVRTRQEGGRPVDPAAVAELYFRAGGAPVGFRDLVRDYLTGAITAKRGRKPAPREEQIYRMVAAHRVERWKRAYARKRDRAGYSSDPYREALFRVAGELDVPESTLDKWCYPRS